MYVHLRITITRKNVTASFIILNIELNADHRIVVQPIDEYAAGMGPKGPIPAYARGDAAEGRISSSV